MDYKYSRKPIDKKLRLISIFLILFSFFFIIYVYTFFHEAGHAIVGLSFGQKLTNFDINIFNFQPHVSMSGELSSYQRAVRSIAGSIFPLIIWVIFILAVPKRSNFLIEFLKFGSSISILFSTVVWVILPILYLLGKAPSRDDVTHFLNASQMNPILLSVLSAIVCFIIWKLFLRKTEGIKDQMLLIRNLTFSHVSTGLNTQIPIMLAVIVGVTGISILLNTFVVQKQSEFSVPENFYSIAAVELSTDNYDAINLYQFSIHEPTFVGIYLEVENLNTTLIELRLTKPENKDEILFYGKDIQSDKGFSLWQETLPVGDYQLIFSSDKGSGIFSLYTNLY
ncbi:MAG TPA: M50 family metallopeptidase [Anaerolineaceae bacterium]|nr:M50 family metallopeptidase [Anaerolineaceae bacterium]